MKQSQITPVRAVTLGIIAFAVAGIIGIAANTDSVPGSAAPESDSGQMMSPDEIRMQSNPGRPASANQPAPATRPDFQAWVDSPAVDAADPDSPDAAPEPGSGGMAPPAAEPPDDAPLR